MISRIRLSIKMSESGRKMESMNNNGVKSDNNDDQQENTSTNTNTNSSKSDHLVSETGENNQTSKHSTENISCVENAVANNESNMTEQNGASENEMKCSSDAEEIDGTVRKENPLNDAEHVEECEIDSLLAEGTEFESFDAFRTALSQYSEATGVSFSRSDSLSVDRAYSITKHKMYNPAILFTLANYTCIYGGKKLKSKSSGLRNASSKKCDCPVRLRLAVTSDGQRLVMKESKLDCHNHSIEEDKKRLRHLDEETEQEIYNLISLHQNKRLARMMVRDKLTKETGKEITMKDICNIEKRVAKKMQKMNEAESNDKENTASDAEEENSNSDEGNEEEGDSEHEEAGEDSNSEKKRQASKSSASRPRRHVREPSRFKDFIQKSETKTAMPAAESSLSEKRHRGLGRPKVKTEPENSTPSAENKTPKVGRGRKRKLSPTEVTSVEYGARNGEVGQGQTEEPSKPAQSKKELKERKIGLLEELLDLEKKKMKMMEKMMGKLDKILENQEKEKCQNQNG